MIGFDGHIFVCGGVLHTSGRFTYRDTCEGYDPISDVWTTLREAMGISPSAGLGMTAFQVQL